MKIQEAEINKRTIFQHDRQSNGSRDFMALGREILERLHLQPTTLLIEEQEQTASPST